MQLLDQTTTGRNRSQAIRWIIGRIRERPAYAGLRERAAGIEELKVRL
jgi:hypothetical protein